MSDTRVVITGVGIVSCVPLNYLRGESRDARLARVMSNTFAFGGINTSLIFGRV